MSDTTETTTTTAGAGTTPGADSGSGTSAATPPTDEKKFTQAELNAILAEEKRREEARRRDAEARAKAAGEWQKVAESTVAERDQLRGDLSTKGEQIAALQAQLAAQAAVVEKLIAAELKALPEALRELAPGGDDLVARLEWVAKAKKAAEQAQAVVGTPAGPRGTGAAAVVQPNQLDKSTARQHGLDYASL